MIETNCLTGLTFSITGDPYFADGLVNFGIALNNPEDAADIQACEWYLNDLLIPGESGLTFSHEIDCGSYSIGARLLGSSGWSGIRYLNFHTCKVPLSRIIEGPATVSEGASAQYKVIQLFSDGAREDVTSGYTFSSTEGVFSGTALSLPPNSQYGDNRVLTITAVKNGEVSLTRKIAVRNTTPLTVTAIGIEGPDTLNEGETADYFVKVTLSNGSKIDVTNTWVFKSTAGVFRGNTFTAYTNRNHHDNREVTISATTNGKDLQLKTVTIKDTTPVRLLNAFIEGPSAIDEGSTAAFTVKGNFSDGSQQDISTAYTFSSSEGSFSGNTFTANSNSVYGDSRYGKIRAAGGSAGTLTKDIYIRDATPVVLVSALIEGPATVAEGATAVYTVKATYSDGSVRDVTTEYTFSSDEGSFSGNMFTASSNTVHGDSRYATITATKGGSPVLTKSVYITDTSPVTMVSAQIQGSSLVKEGQSVSYTVKATYSDESTGDITAQCTFSASEGSFTANTYTANSNGVSNDTRLVTISAQLASGPVYNITITVSDNTVIEVDQFDFMTVRYQWQQGSGRDLDIKVGYENNGITADNNYVGFGFFREIPQNVTDPATNAYVWWASDNTDVQGIEGVLIGIKKFIDTFPASPNIIEVGLYAKWYGEAITGNFTVELVTYLGGTMSLSGTDFINTGGTPKPANIINVTIPKLSQHSKIAVLKYNKTAKKATIELLTQGGGEYL